MTPQITITEMDCVRISAPSWFKRPDFISVLNQEPEIFKHSRSLATWHTGGEPDEFSDLFTIYDNGEGKLKDILPDDIWEEIEQIVGDRYAVLWIFPV